MRVNSPLLTPQVIVVLLEKIAISQQGGTSDSYKYLLARRRQ